MGLTLLLVLPLITGLAILVVMVRRAELRASTSTRLELVKAKDRGSHRAPLQHPVIDSRHCIGCGTCVSACPESGVLGMIHGQATVIHGARCVGHGRCADACPVGGIAITMGDLSERRDLPALDDHLEAVGVAGLFIAGELGGQALVRTAVAQGTAVANTIAHRLQVGEVQPVNQRQTVIAGTACAAAETDREVDLLIVGAGPAGLACALQARASGIEFLGIEREPCIGGTVAGYPRKKLVMTQAMALPLHGKLKQLSYAKEELVELWEDLHQRHSLPIRTGVSLTGLRTETGTGFVADTTAGSIRARHVCLALGRRGTPRQLGVPGEELSKVSYSLTDAQSYRGRHLLVVGGGDSAVEAAMGLGRQPGNVVTLSYRKAAFSRLKSRNEARIEVAIAEGTVRVLFSSEVLAIEPDDVQLRASIDGALTQLELPNDEVFVFAGGVPPFALLEASGVSFDPEDRPATIPPPERGTGLLFALSVTFLATLGLAAVCQAYWDYYSLLPGARAETLVHGLLGPKGSLGLAAGLGAAALFVCNLLYLWRRSRLGWWIPGSLRAWMSFHVLTGLLSLVMVLLHAGLSPASTAGGHACLALAVVVVTGSIGRYLYSFVPRVASGATMDLDTLQSRLAVLSGEWDREGGGFGSLVRDRVRETLLEQHWDRGFFARVWSLLRSQLRLRQRLAELRQQGAVEDVPAAEVRRILALARRAHRLALMAAHYEEMRAVLSSWRFFHRWLALLLVLLTVIHIVTACRYGEINWRLLTWFGDNG